MEFHDIKGINPVFWIPDDLDEEFRTLCGIRAVSLVAGEEDFLPKSIITVPFPSRNLKAMVKFLQWKDPEKRGGVGQASLLLLFEQADDAIFYKAKPYLENIFDDIIEKLIPIEEEKKERKRIKSKMTQFQEQIAYVLQDLKEKELSDTETEEFPSTTESDQIIDYKLKMVVLGDPRVGKTSIILRFTDNAFSRTYLPTVGVNLSEKTIKVDGKNIQLVLWDLAGQSKFERTRIHFYQGAEVFLLVFDLTNEKSFSNIREWYDDISGLLNKQNICYLVGNKKDLEEKRIIDYKSAKRLAKELSLNYFETSALTGENIISIFKSVGKEIIKSEKA